MAQRRPISRDRNFVGERPPEGVSPVQSAPPSTPSSQPISRDPTFVGRAGPRGTGRTGQAPTGGAKIGPGPGDPNYRFPADIEQGMGRFATEAVRGFGLHPTDLRTAFDEAMSNPGLVLDIVSGMAEGAKGQVMKSWESLKTGRPADALKHLIYAAVPGVGPALDQATEDLKRGDTAGASGRIAGIFLSLGAGSLREARIPPVHNLRTQNPVQRQAIAYADREGIPVDLATASGKRAVRSWQEGMEFTPGGMLVEAAKRPPRVQALRQSAQRLADDVSPTPVSPEAWGTAARDRVTQARARYTDIADKAYPAFRAATEGSGQLVDIAAVLASKQMQKLWRQLEKKRAATGGLVGRELRAYLKISDLRDLPPGLADIGVIDDILGDMKSYARTERGPIKVVVGALEKQVQAATARAGPEAVEALTRGRQAIRDRARVDAVLDALPDEPVKVFNRYVTSGGTNIEGLRELVKIAPDLGPELGRAWLERHLDPVLSGGGFEKAQTFRNSYNKLDKNTKAIIFGSTENVKAMDNFTQLTAQMGTLANPPGTAGQLIGAGAFSTAAAYIKDSYPGYALFSLLTPAVLSAVFKSPTAVKALTQGLSMATGPGRGTSGASRAAQAAALELVRAAVRESGQPLEPTPVYNPDTTPRDNLFTPELMRRR